MKMKIYCVYDATKKTYGSVHFDVNDGTAIRSFGQQCSQDYGKEQINMFREFPDDYSLVRIGEFNQETGEIRPEKKPVIIITARQFVPLEK